MRSQSFSIGSLDVACMLDDFLDTSTASVVCNVYYSSPFDALLAILSCQLLQDFPFTLT